MSDGARPEQKAGGEPAERLLTQQRLWFGLLALSALVTGYLGVSEYVNKQAENEYGRGFFDIVYYVLQLFVLGSQPLEGPPPYNAALDTARYLAAATTVYAVVMAAWVLFGGALRRWLRRHTRGHAIVVGDTPEARVVAIRRQEAATVRGNRSKVFRIERGDVDELRAAGAAGARVIYACTDDREDIGANVAVALAASAGRGADLRVNVQVTDPTLALGLKARRLMVDADDNPVIDFFSVDEMAARRYAEAQPLDGVEKPRILVAGAGAFGQTTVVELSRRWGQLTPQRPDRIEFTLVDVNASAVAAQLVDRWQVVAESAIVTAVDSPPDSVTGWDEPATPYYRAFFCQEDEQQALSTALSATSLWSGGAGSVVVRLSLLARHVAAFDPADPLLDDLTGRLGVVDVADSAGELVAQDREPLRDFSLIVHQRYLAAGSGSAFAAVPWDQLSGDMKAANRAQAHDVPNKLRRLNATIAPRSARRPVFRVSPAEIEMLAIEEHDRWMRERKSRGWRHAPERDDANKLHPLLVPWDELTEADKDKDRAAARGLQTYDSVLAEIGLQIVRLGQPSTPATLPATAPAPAPATVPTQAPPASLQA